ncbi:hypothetical protein [Aeromonas salmonicida]|uniref:hypothetical protein n=1 Tax=Aeromonas salmonicida TaxID=645 RepID=UPI0028A36AA3|nr:hypothetical protein [Aeromonas salmonicida subsp. salmonicida]MDF2401972.1 hypothetical protein [Aeromonas sp. 5HA1]
MSAKITAETAHNAVTQAVARFTTAATHLQIIVPANITTQTAHNAITQAVVRFTAAATSKSPSRPKSPPKLLTKPPLERLRVLQPPPPTYNAPS